MGEALKLAHSDTMFGESGERKGTLLDSRGGVENITDCDYFGTGMLKKLAGAQEIKVTVDGLLAR